MYICEPIITGHFGVVILVIVQTMQLYLKNAVIFVTHKCIYMSSVCVCVKIMFWRVVGARKK